MDKYIDNFNYELLKKLGSPCNKFTVNFILNEIDKETMKGKNLIYMKNIKRFFVMMDYRVILLFLLLIMNTPKILKNI